MAQATDTVIIGAGPAGLAVGACLKGRGVPFEMIERQAHVGWSWHHHYERLHLHTVKNHSALPFVPFPDHLPTYPSRDQVAAYLVDYAARFNLQPRLGESVTRAARVQGEWRIETDKGPPLRARRLVVATGYNRAPNLPRFEGAEDFGGEIRHAARYTNGAAWQGRSVLVVGCGNTGAEIAICLWEHGARVTLVVRSPIHVAPRDLLGTPAQEANLLLSRLPTALRDRLSVALLDLVVGDLSAYGIRRPSQGPTAQILERGRIPLIDVGTIDLIKQGHVKVAPAVERLVPGGARFVDGREGRFDAIIVASGYKAALGDFLEGAQGLVNDQGYPLWHGKEVPSAPGLYFVGFSNPPTGFLREIAIEARRVAHDIASKGRAAP